jgi:hypothetical protein
MISIDYLLVCHHDLDKTKKTHLSYRNSITIINEMLKSMKIKYTFCYYSSQSRSCC